MAYHGNHIENEAAYQNAIHRRIQENARTGRRRRWLAEDETREALMDRVHNTPGAFMMKMSEAYHEWGSLTAGQEAAVRRIFAGNDERKAEYKQRDAQSQHIGEVGQRINLEATISFVTSYETHYGTMFVTGLRDADNNVIIYKGSKEIGDKGETVQLKATIKEHGIRDGVNQTIISRPTCKASTK